jgi:outer membrane protein
MRNTRIRTGLALLGVVVGASALVEAQAPTTGPQLTLQQAQQMAVKNHPEVLASEALSQRANQITREARSAYYPSINELTTGTQANVNSRLGAGPINDPRLFNHAGSGLSLSQLITDSGRTPNLVANAKYMAQASREDVRATQYDVIEAVTQAYFDVLLGQDLVKVAQQTVTTRQTVVEQVNELFRNQLKSQVDLSFAQVNLTDAKLMLLRAQDRLTSAYAELARALGTEQVKQYQLMEEPVPSTPPATPDGLIAQAFRDRPELASIRLQREADQKFVYAERDLKRPSVSLTGVGGALPYIRPGNANPNIPEGYEALSLTVQIPVFNGFLFSARRQAAEYQLKATEQRVRDLQEQIARDVREAWARAQTAYQAIAATAELLRQANLALNLAQGRYNLGLASIVELTQAQLSQTQAEVENVNAKYEYQESYASLQYTLGSLH